MLDCNRAFSFTYRRLPDREYRFDSVLLEATEDRIVLEHELRPSTPLRIEEQTVLDDGYSGVWFLFQGCPWDIARVYHPDGTWSGYYVDVLRPVRWQGDDPDSLEPLVDLFLDLWITPEGHTYLLDQEELDAAVRTGGIALEEARTAQAMASHLLSESEAGRFPSDFVSAWERHP